MPESELVNLLGDEIHFCDKDLDEAERQYPFLNRDDVYFDITMRKYLDREEKFYILVGSQAAI